MIEFNVPIEFFKNSQALGFQVHSAIRKAVQDSYLIGIETVGDEIQRKVPSFELFMSVVDVETIKSISQEMFDQFWKLGERLLTRETSTVEKDNVKEDKKPLNVEFAIESLSSLIVFSAYNKAISSKLRNVVGSKELGVGLTGAFSLKKIFQKVATKISDVFGSLLGFERLEGLKAQEMFLTKEDDKVDQICQPYNRRIYEVDDPDKPIPQELHYGCRCILIPVVSDEPEVL